MNLNIPPGFSGTCKILLFLHVLRISARLITALYPRLSHDDDMTNQDMPKVEQQTKQLLCKFAACTEDEREFLLKTLDCMAKQMLSQHEKAQLFLILCV